MNHWTIPALAGLLAVPATAQLHGLAAHDGAVSILAVCGNCTATSNYGFARVPVIAADGAATRFGVRLYGRRNQPAVLLANAGFAVDCSVLGYRFPGIREKLTVGFPLTIVAVGTLNRPSARPGCGRGQGELVPALPIPAFMKNRGLGLQGVVDDDRDGVTTFTRALLVGFR